MKHIFVGVTWLCLAISLQAAETNSWFYSKDIVMSCGAPTGYARLLFPGGLKKALTMSYDDNREYDRRLVKIFNAYGIRGTFHVISDALDKPGYITRKEIKDGLYNGHEVACHTVHHPPLSKQDDAGLTYEVMANRRDLESLVGYPVRGLAYPGGDCDDRVARFLPSLGIEYARTVGESHGMELPKDPWLLCATCHHGSCLADLERFLTWPTYPALMYVWGHSYEFEEGKNWTMIEEFCRKAGRRKDIWYATNIEVIDYMNAAKRLVVEADGSHIFNPSAMPIWLEVRGKTAMLPPGVLTDLAKAAAVEPVVTQTDVKAPAQWTAYDDVAWQSAQSGNGITMFGPGGQASGALVDALTGTALPVKIAFMGEGTGFYGDAPANVNKGQAASDMFDGKVDLRGYVSWPSNKVTMTVSGLDPTREYDVVLYGSRGLTDEKYRTRKTVFTLSDVSSFKNESSTKLAIAKTVQDRDTVTCIATDVGQIVRFSHIKPGDDGDIQIDMEGHEGGYLNAVMVRTQPEN